MLQSEQANKSNQRRASRDEAMVIKAEVDYQRLVSISQFVIV